MRYEFFVSYAAYGRESRPVFTRLGGRIAWQGKFELTLIGPREERDIFDHPTPHRAVGV
jgi:hypothetical protein